MALLDTLLCAAQLLRVASPTASPAEVADPFAAVRDATAENASAPATPAESPSADPAAWVEALRPTLEIIARGGARREDRDGQVALAQQSAWGLGLDLFGPIVKPAGTWGAADLQLRLLLDARPTPRLEIHNAYLEHRLAGLGVILRGGHFQLPFNLEGTELDTHTTLLQLSNAAHLGLKHDWGLSARGPLGPLDYELAYSIGSGMGFAPLRALGLASGRLGWRAPGEWISLGLSGLGGEHLAMAEAGNVPGAVRGWRLGGDLALRFLWLSLLSELALGQDDGLPRAAALARLQAETPDRLWQLAAQLSAWDQLMPAGSWWRGEADAGLRLGWLARDAFVRLNVSREQRHGAGQWLALAQLYVPTEVDPWRE